MNSLVKKVAGAGVALTTMTTASLADITIYGVKNGGCFKTVYSAQTGMHDSIKIGNKAPVVISLPETKYRGNSNGAKVVFGAMSQVAANLVTSGAADGAAVFMKCSGPGAGSWEGFCGKGKISKHGTDLGDIFERQCKKVSGWGNNGPEKLYETLRSFNGTSGKVIIETTKKPIKADTSGNDDVIPNRSQTRVVSEGSVTVQGGGKAKIRACKDASGCLSFELKLQ